MAAPKTRPRKTRSNLVAAGDAALQRGAWSSARRHFTRAIAARETAEALEGLGWAEWWLDDPPASFAARERAYRLYQQRKDARAAARIALALGVDSIDYRGEPAVGRGWLERARRLLEGHPGTPEFGWALLWDGHWARVFESDPRRAQQCGIKAAALGRSLQLNDLEMLGSALQGLALIDRGRIDQGMRRLDEAMTAALAGDMLALDAIGQTCCFLMHACDRVRDYDRAVQWCGRVKAFCQAWHIKTLFTICRTRYAAVLISHGEWDEAERELNLAQAHQDSRPYVARAAWVQLGELRRRQGRADDARHLFDRADGHPLALLGRAAMALDAGEVEHAVDYAERFLAAVPGDVPMEVAAGLELLVHACAAGAQLSKAARSLRRLRRVARTLNIVAMRALVLSAESAIAAARDNRGKARVGYRQAADLFTRAGMPYEAARSATRSDRLLNTLPQSAGAPTASASSATSRLTPRECEVLRLVAQGLGDRSMAGRLRLSEHTIHRHVANILTKLDAPSRSAAVAQAVRQALI